MMNNVKIGDNKTAIGATTTSGLIDRLKEIGGIIQPQGAIAVWPDWYVLATHKYKPGQPYPWQQMMLDAAKEIETLQALAGRYHKQLYG